MSKPIFKFALRDDIKDDKRFMPTRAHDTDTGWDVRACQSDKQPIVLKPFQQIKIPLGFRSIPEKGWWYKVVPRSSTFLKKNLHALYGVADFGWRGESCFVCQYIPELNINSEMELKWQFYHHNNWYGIKSEDFNISTNFEAKPLVINFGDAIGQIIPVRREEMEVVEISNADFDQFCNEENGTRGTGGFGSTG